MKVCELIERLREYKPATEVYISTDDVDPIGGAEEITGIGEVKDVDEAVDGIYLLSF
jgi:hypothetical protein